MNRVQVEIEVDAETVTGSVSVLGPSKAIIMEGPDWRACWCLTWFLGPDPRSNETLIKAMTAAAGFLAAKVAIAPAEQVPLWVAAMVARKAQLEWGEMVPGYGDSVDESPEKSR